MPAKEPMAIRKGIMTQASYDIVIPGSVRQDKRLSPLEMLLYGEIRGLCKLEGYCWASNKTLAERLQSKKRAIIRWIQKLVKCGHIRIERTSENLNLRKIYLTERVSPQTPPVFHKTPPVSAVVKQGVSRRTLPPPGIRKNTLKTTTTTKKAVGVVNEIPEKIKNRFGSAKVLRNFHKHCGGDVGLMQRYLDYADRERATNPPGLAASLASQRGADGPPGGAAAKACVLCEKPAVKYVQDGKREIGLCETHRQEYIRRKDAGKQGHLAMIAQARAG